MFCPASRIRLGLVVWLFACTSIVHATTITVMQNGSGDFAQIQPALDVVASGDTLLIGPGEYFLSNPTEIPGYAWDVDVFASIPVAELTIIGAGASETVIGPRQFIGSTETFSPKGLVWLDGDELRVSGVTFRNCYDGIHTTNAPIFISDCQFIDNFNGIIWKTGGTGGRISRSHFEASIPGGPDGIDLLGDGSDIVVEDCLFDGTKVLIEGLESISVLRCEIRNMVVGLQVENGTHCTIDDCMIFNCVNVGVSVWGNSTICEIQNSEISGGGVAVAANSFCRLIASNVVLSVGYWGVFELSNANEAEVSNCQLIPGSGPAIRSYRHPSYGEVVHDLRNNFWGTIDGDEIRSLILDGIDDPYNTSTVMFEPFVGDLSSTDIPKPLDSLSVHPNPFNPRTTISFSIGYPQNVELSIFDMTGKRIALLADRSFQAGPHSIDWQGKDLHGRAAASGSYLLRMITDEGVQSEKMMLVR